MSKVENPAAAAGDAKAPEKADAAAAATKAPSRYQLGQKLVSFKRKLNAYTRIKDRCLAALKNEKDPAAADDAQDSKKAEKKPVSKVMECYRLIRNFTLTYNWIKLDYTERKDAKLAPPKEFEDRLSQLLTKDVLTKFFDAMNGPIEDVATNMPGEFDDAKAQKVMKFIDEADQKSVIDFLKKNIEELQAELDVLKSKQAAEPKSPKSSSKASKKKEAAKKSVISDAETKKKKSFNAEEQFKDMIGQIKQRISSIRFLKDDYQVYSEVNGQIDLLLFDANFELHQIKKSLKKKFENAQTAKKATGRRGRKGGQSNSVFSKGHREEFD